MNNVAVFVPGALGDLRTPYQVPAITNLITRLSERYRITAYSLIKPDNNRETILCGNAVVKFIDARYDDSMLRRILKFRSAFLHDHVHERFELLHAFWVMPSGSAALIAGRNADVPTLISAVGGEAASLKHIRYGNMRNPMTKFLTLQTLERADAITALTTYQRDHLKKSGLRRMDCSVIPFGIDTQTFSPTGEIPFAPPYRFLHVSNMNRVKDVATLIRAFHKIVQHADAQLRIVGFDLLDGEPAALVRSLDLEERVEFLGYIPQHELATQYRWAHFFLLTSMYEAQAVVVAEAAACGAVVCGTRVGLLADLGDAAAICCEVGDHDELANNVLAVIQHHAQYIRLREASMKWATEHSITWSAKQFAELYDFIISGNRG